MRGSTRTFQAAVGISMVLAVFLINCSGSSGNTVDPPPPNFSISGNHGLPGTLQADVRISCQQPAFTPSNGSYALDFCVDFHPGRKGIGSICTNEANGEPNFLGEHATGQWLLTKPDSVGVWMLIMPRFGTSPGQCPNPATIPDNRKKLHMIRVTTNG